MRIQSLCMYIFVFFLSSKRLPKPICDPFVLAQSHGPRRHSRRANDPRNPPVARQSLLGDSAAPRRRTPFRPPPAEKIGPGDGRRARSAAAHLQPVSRGVCAYWPRHGASAVGRPRRRGRDGRAAGRLAAANPSEDNSFSVCRSAARRFGARADQAGANARGRKGSARFPTSPAIKDHPSYGHGAPAKRFVFFFLEIITYALWTTNEFTSSSFIVYYKFFLKNQLQKSRFH